MKPISQKRSSHLAQFLTRYAGVAAVTALMAALHLAAPAGAAAGEERRIPVEVAKVEKRAISEYEYGQGTLKSTRREHLVFQASGRVVFLKSSPSGGPLREGDWVKGPGKRVAEGELLAQLQHRRGDAELSAGRAQLDRARAQLKKADGDYARARRLRAADAIPASRYDNLKTAYEEALAGVRAAEARIDSTRSGLADTQLRAPFDGQVAFVNIREGQYYSQQRFDPSSEERAARTAPIVIIDPTAFEIVVDLPQLAGSRVRVGQSAYIVGQEALAAAQAGGEEKAQSLRDYLVPAHVIAVSPAVNPENRAMRVRIRIEGDSGPRLVDGGFVTAWIEVGRKADAVTIPMNALLPRSGKFFAHVVTDAGRAERRRLTLGLQGLDGIEVLEGLKPGETVITKGKSRLRPGAAVRVVNPEGAEKAPAKGEEAADEER